MKTRIAILSALVLTASPILWSQNQPGGNAAVQERVAQLKQSIAENRARLMKYQWQQNTTVSIKGDVKKDDVMSCRYAPDGTVQKTPLGSGPVQQKQVPTSGIKGKIAQKKIAEMKDYTDRLKSLISHYAPPNPTMIQSAVMAHNVSLDASGGIANLIFTNFYKPGDRVVFGIDTATRKLVSFNVNTYLDDPKSDIVTMANKFDTLQDGTTYLAETDLNATGKQIQITTTNSNYEPIGQ
jgi:hypothetical protein